MNHEQTTDGERAVARLLATVTTGEAPVSRPRFCGCGGEVREFTPGYRAWACPPCIAKDRESRTLAAVAHAEGQIPARYDGIRLNSPPVIAKAHPKAVAAARRALADGVDVLTLRGGPGAAKSLLAAALCRDVLDAAVSGCSPATLSRASRLRWMSAMKIGTARRESPLSSEPALLREAKAASFLVIDEFGREAEPRDMFEVLDWRHSQRLTTIFTTGMTVAALEALDDGGLARRILEPPFAALADLGERQ